MKVLNNLITQHFHSSTILNTHFFNRYIDRRKTNWNSKISTTMKKSVRPLMACYPFECDLQAVFGIMTLIKFAWGSYLGAPFALTARIRCSIGMLTHMPRLFIFIFVGTDNAPH